MLSFAALSINRFFTTAPKLERETPGSRTATLRALSDLGEKLALSIRIQHEDIFRSMHQL